MKREIKHAWRILLRQKGLSVVVIATLAIGIGASTAIFSFVNSVLLQQLPFEDPEQLVIIESVRGGEKGRISQREIADVKETTSLFEDVAGYNPGAQYNLTGQGEPEEIPTTICSSNLFSVLGGKFVQGKAWPEEFDGRRAFGIVLTEELWKRKFGAEVSHLNGTITLDAYHGYTVFGVLSAGFDFPRGIQMFRSASWFDAQSSDRNFRDRIGVARLRKDANINIAREKLDELGKKLASLYPETNGGVGFTVMPLDELYVGQIRPYLWLLSGAVLLVLLIACVNVSNLMISAGAERDKEVTIRSIMGARRVTLVRQFLVESLMLSLFGGLLGIALAWILVNYFGQAVRADLPHWLPVGLDYKALFFTLGISLAVGILAGLVPSLKFSGASISRVIKQGKGSTGGQRSGRIRNAFVVVELSLSLVLLVGTALLLESVTKLQRQELGFNPAQTLTYRVALPWRKYGDMNTIHPFFRQLLAETRAIPGVESASLNDNLPLSYEANMENRDSEFTLEGQTFEEQKSNPYVKYQTIAGDYFQQMEIPLLEGRYLTDTDDTLGTPVAVINRNLALKLFPQGGALNRRLKFGKPDSESAYRTIVGIVGDVRHEDVRKASTFDIYLSAWQRPEPNQFILVKTKANPMDLAQQVTAAVYKVDGEQSVYDVRLMEDRVDKKLWQDKLVSRIFFLFAFVATLLAGIGIYSVISYAVLRRTKELGVRKALGATGISIVWMIQREVILLFSIALFVGIAITAGFANLLTPFMYGVSHWDPGIYIAASLFLMLVALLAALVPAFRATVVNPVRALRNE